MRQLAIAAAVGRGLKGVRGNHALRQDDVARAARQAGLHWTRSVVVALEAGRRYLTIDEFARLPLILELLGVVASGQAEAQLESHAALAQVKVAPLLEKKALRIGVVIEVESAEAARHALAGGLGMDEATVYAAYRAAGGDLEQKVARQFRVDPLIVALVAVKAWGRSLSEERDRRVADQAASSTSPRAIQALRGHVTRALRKELDPRLAAARKHLRRKKGGHR